MMVSVQFLCILSVKHRYQLNFDLWQLQVDDEFHFRSNYQKLQRTGSIYDFFFSNSFKQYSWQFIYVRMESYNVYFYKI